MTGTELVGPGITDGRIFVTRVSIHNDSSGDATVTLSTNSSGSWHADPTAFTGGLYRQNTMYGISATWTDTGVTGQRIGFVILNIQIWGPVDHEELETNTRPTNYAAWQQWFVRVDFANRATAGGGGSVQDDGNSAQGTFRWPITGTVANLENDFGMFRQRGANRGYHLGIDILAPAGTQVFPVAAGRVVWSGAVTGSPGYAAIMEHTSVLYINGVGRSTRWRSWYMYLATQPRVGTTNFTTWTPLSTIVAYPGSTPDHLHLEISMSPRATWSAAEPIRTGTRTVRQLEIDSDRIHPMRLWRSINANRILT